MIRRLFLLFAGVAGILSEGCVKETYDMNKLSKEVHLSPVIALSAIKGDVSLSDIVKSNDTIVFGLDKLVKIVFREDSIVDIKMADFYNLSNILNLNRAYTLGDLVIDPFQSQTSFTLNEITLGLSSALRNQFVAADDGSLHLFPAFPAVTLAEKALANFVNFETAVFRSGYLDITVKNNLTAPLNGASVKIFNTLGHSQIGSDVPIPAIPAGQSRTVSVDLADMTVTNSLRAVLILSGSTGTTSPVLISLNSSNVQLTVAGRDLKVKSGRVVLPQQAVTSFQGKDTVTFNPGGGLELDEISTLSGNMDYRIVSASPVKVTLNIKLPTVRTSGVQVTETVAVNPNSTKTGTIPVNNTLFDLGSDVMHPYNRVPMENTLTVTSDGSLVSFNSTDAITTSLKLTNPVYDYLKGYFGQNSCVIASDSIKTGFNEIMNNITGSFVIADPVMRINYSNSFALPVQLTFNAFGKKNPETVNLGYSPLILEYPAAPAEKKITSSFSVDKSNSAISPLISMPPEYLVYSGNAKMNPAGNNGLRDSYVFGNSSLTASIEMEIPMNFRTSNLQFADTVDNFLKNNNTNDDNAIKPEDFKLLRVDLKAENGFPLGISVKMSLFDSTTGMIKSTVDATDIIKAAPIDTDGKAKGATVTATSIEFNADFFRSINKSDRIIFRFSLRTSEEGAKDVKIYSDYRIKFNAALVLKSDMNLK
jgi:hypothetical protein